MRIAELSTITGVAVPSIKFYLREGLMAAGERTSPNQSTYSDSHVARLRLIRALVDVGGLSVAAVRDVLAAVDDTTMPLDWSFGIAQAALSRGAAEQVSSATGTGDQQIARLIERTGWRVSAGNPGIAMAARVLDSYDGLGHSELSSTLDGYSEAALRIAENDLDAVAAQPDRAEMTQVVVIGTVLGDVLVAGLRRMAQEHVAHLRYGSSVTAADATG